jgi:hypothetical protein
VKRKLLAISWDLYRFLSTAPGDVVRVVSNDIPVDATVAHATFDAMTDRLILCVEHESFPEIEEGKILPWLMGPRFERQAERVQTGREFI